MSVVDEMAKGVAGITTTWRDGGGEQGLQVMRIDNAYAHAVISPYGAQILEYQAHGQPPLLWQSARSHYQDGKAIRGGIPLCFPWFGAHPTESSLPAHGFARTRTWQLVAARLHLDGHRLVFRLEDDAATRALWPYGFRAEVEMHIGAQLSLTLTVTNRDSQPFEFSFAFHSYFAIADVRQAQVTGLENVPYLDQLAPALGDQQHSATPIRFTAETDRIYQGGAGHYRIESLAQSAQHQPIQISAPECSSVIVWNPWVEKAARLADMAAEAWPQMLCVECGQVGTAWLRLAAGETRAFGLKLAHR